jgi:hypothetical protein
MSTYNITLCNIELTGLPRWLTNAGLKFQLKRFIVQEAANIHVSIDYDAEDYYWDDVRNSDRTYTARVVIPDADAAIQFRERCRAGIVQIIHPNTNIGYVVQGVTANGPPILSFQEVEMLKKKRSSPNGSLKAAPKVSLEGILGPVTKVECGSFQSGEFHSAAAWLLPASQLSVLSFFKRVLRFGLSYQVAPGSTPASWTGQWVDMKLRNVQQVMIDEAKKAIYFALNMPPRFYQRDVYTREMVRGIRK